MRRSGLFPVWIRLGLLLFVALVLIALLQRASSRESEREPGRRPEASAATEPESEGRLRELEVEEPTATSVSERIELENELEGGLGAVPSRTKADGVEILVYREGESRPAAGVDVFFLDSTMLAPDESSELDSLALRYGRRYRTNAEGIALVPRPRYEARIVAREPGRFGSMTLPGDGRDPWSHVKLYGRPAVLVLLPDPEFAVFVEEAAGKRVGGVGVGLFGGGGIGGIVYEIAESDAEGRAVLHPRRIFRLRQVFVALAIEDPELETIEINAASLANEAPVLRLPCTGSVEVRVTDAATGTDESLDSAFLDFERGRAIPSCGAKLRSGRALFPRVRVGARFRVRAGDLRSDVVALTVDGERREVVLWNPHAGAGFVARLVRSPGKPLAEYLVRVSCLEDPRGGTVLRTDATGRLRWSCSEERIGKALHQVLASAGPFLPPLSARLELTPSPGLNDLGDVLLQPTSTLVGGRVVDEDGAPIEGVSVRCGLLLPGDQRPRWGDDLQSESDRNGRFVIRGEAGGAALELSAERAGWAAARVPAQPGDENVRIVLARSGRIVGRLEVGRLSDLSELRVQAHSRSDETLFQEGSVSADSHVSDVDRMSVGRFYVSELPAGDYDVLVQWSPGWSYDPPDHVLVADIGHVRVAPGETTSDPRLDPIDVSTLLHEIELRVVNERGEAVDKVQVRLRNAHPLADGEDTLPPRDVALRGSIGRIQSPWPIVDVEVTAQGLRPALVRNVAGFADVVLPLGLPVRIVASAEVAALLGPHRASLALVPVEGGESFDKLRFAAWDLSNGTELGVDRAGDYRVVLSVTRTNPGGMRSFVYREPLAMPDADGLHVLGEHPDMRAFLVR